VTDLFDSAAFDEARVEALVWVPEHGAPAPAPPGPAGVPARVRELRALLHHLREAPRVERLVALVSAAVYRLLPGNTNRAAEGHALELSPDAHPDVRAWVDCDVMLREEAGRAAPLRLLLRVPPVIAPDGSIHLHPALDAAGAALRPIGFDPLWSVVAADDVARAVRLALLAPAAGVFNVAGDEALPLSWLLRWSGRAPWPVPGPLLGAARDALRRLGARETARALETSPLCFGLTLDARRAATGLGFRPRWRVALPPRGASGVLRLEPQAAAAPGPASERSGALA
jgi:UDP-glucose 4-epimerase